MDERLCTEVVLLWFHTGQDMSVLARFWGKTSVSIWYISVFWPAWTSYDNTPARHLLRTCFVPCYL